MTERPAVAAELDLAPHPEGGWYRETWRSAVTVHPDGYGGPRATATAIYFLLCPGEESRWHVVRSDELWFWHSGGPLALRFGGAGEAPDQAAQETHLLDRNQPQLRVPAGVWQAAAPAGDAPVLVSCVVSPGFEFEDFRLA